MFQFWLKISCLVNQGLFKVSDYHYPPSIKKTLVCFHFDNVAISCALCAKTFICCLIYLLSNVQYKTYLDDFQVFLAPLRREALQAAELLRLRVGVMHGGPGAADELARVQRAGHGLDLQSFPQRAAIAGGIHHHGLRAWIDLRLHHGDL